MADGGDNHRSRENRARVRELFLREWDPIGLFQTGSIDCPEDEYDAYVARACVMLMDEQAQAAAIADDLYRVATEHMSLSNHADQRARSQRVAGLLVAMRAGFSAD